MVVPSFVRKTYLILPRPVQVAVRWALPKRAVREQQPKELFLDRFDAVTDAVFAPLWKE